MLQLWKLLLSAQDSPNGIPLEIIEDQEEQLRLQSESKHEKLKFLENILGVKISDSKLNFEQSKCINHFDKTNNNEKRSYYDYDRQRSLSSDKKKSKKNRDRNYDKDRERNKKHKKRKYSYSSSSSSSTRKVRRHSRSRSRSKTSKNKIR